MSSQSENDLIDRIDRLEERYQMFIDDKDFEAAEMVEDEIDQLSAELHIMQESPYPRSN